MSKRLSKASEGHGSRSKVAETGLLNQIKIVHKKTDYIRLIEDVFGYFVDEMGVKHEIKRFTWFNHNGISAQVITFGARITSLQLPNRKRKFDDVVLGFGDTAGYIHYDNLHMGSILGRVNDKIENATFVLDQKQYWLTANDGPHHSNGGIKGLDRVVWVPSVQGTKVLLSYVSRDLDEGYPGDLFIRVVFELTSKNEFTIDIDAVTTRPTILNLSHLLYFNLGGHGSGPDEILKHIVTMNSNCYLPLKDNDIPTGCISNVIYTKNDFQIPKLLKTDMLNGEEFNEHLCVNRGIDQGLCFVARAFHPPSGRILEMYSNQYGVHFSTANHFERAPVDLPISISSTSSTSSKTAEDKMFENIFILMEGLYGSVRDTLQADSKSNFQELRNVVGKLRVFNVDGHSEMPEDEKPILNPTQVKYLEGMLEAIATYDTDTNYADVEMVVRKLLDVAIILTDLEVEEVKSVKSEKSEIKEQGESEFKSKQDLEMERKGLIQLKNIIPPFYTDGKIHGKNGAVYKKHGAISFQSENYPNAIYHEKFPNCVLRPGETYNHNIVYKFWIQSGSPHRWVKRNFPPTKS